MGSLSASDADLVAHGLSAARAGAFAWRSRRIETAADHQRRRQSMGGAELLSSSFLEVSGDHGTGKTKLLMQCIVEAVLPRDLGGQESRVYWLDCDLGFVAAQLGRMLGFEIMMRAGSREYTQAGRILCSSSMELLWRLASEGGLGLASEVEDDPPPEDLDQLNRDVDRAVQRALSRVIVYSCGTPMELEAALSLIAASLEARRHPTAAVVVDSIDALVATDRSRMGETASGHLWTVLSVLNRISQSLGTAVLVSRTDVPAAVVSFEAARLVSRAGSNAEPILLHQAPPDEASHSIDLASSRDHVDDQGDLRVRSDDSFGSSASDAAPVHAPLSSSSSSRCDDDHGKESVARPVRGDDDESVDRARDAIRRLIPPPTGSDAVQRMLDGIVTIRVRLLRVAQLVGRAPSPPAARASEAPDGAFPGLGRHLRSPSHRYLAILRMARPAPRIAPSRPRNPASQRAPPSQSPPTGSPPGLEEPSSSVGPRGSAGLPPRRLAFPYRIVAAGLIEDSLDPSDSDILLD